MQVSSPHAQDDPAPSRSRGPPPQAEGAGGPGRSAPVRLPSPGGPPRRRATDAGRAPVPARPAHAGCHSCPTGQGRESGARTSVKVVDASALLECFSTLPRGSASPIDCPRRARRSTRRTSWTWKSPRCCDATPPRARWKRGAGCRRSKIWSTFPSFAILDLLLSRIWDLRNNLTAYDAANVALAEALAAPLVTRDAALASPGAHRARVELM